MSMGLVYETIEALGRYQVVTQCASLFDHPEALLLAVPLFDFGEYAIVVRHTFYDQGVDDASQFVGGSRNRLGSASQSGLHVPVEYPQVRLVAAKRLRRHP